MPIHTREEHLDELCPSSRIFCGVGGIVTLADKSKKTGLRINNLEFYHEEHAAVQHAEKH